MKQSKCPTCGTQGTFTEETQKKVEAASGTCLWVYHDYGDDGAWIGGCDFVWPLGSDDPDDSGMKFCPGCGKTLEIVERPLEPQDEEEGDE